MLACSELSEICHFLSFLSKESPQETPSSGSLLSIVSSQRERFRTRNLELEAVSTEECLTIFDMGFLDS